jgi:AraC-like DNA-binding protein
MQIYREITPLHESNVFVVLDSMSNGFNYPIHSHPEYELNLVVGISGTRIVGDSTELFHHFDLVLLGPYLYHKWDGDAAMQASGQPYRVITIQFAMGLFNSELLQKESFAGIRKLLSDSGQGIKFHGHTFEQAMPLMMSMTEDKGFDNVITFLQLLGLLSRSVEKESLASEGFTSQALKSDSNRIQIAYNYIMKRFQDQDIKIGDVAAQVNMSPSAFSHFFHKYTNKSFTQFLVDIRIGHACKMLLDTDETIREIGFQSGFNNIANFNRLFRKYRSTTPLEYRRGYLKKNDFDWRSQITPSQFLPSGKDGKEFKPVKYKTKIVHA